ncbi:hypothetical protein ACFL1X_11620 [Candidatus Hydrogenedentota bacterium]
MSEYQYYEFLAIDRPLSEEEMADLRALSTRAHITPVGFTNHYNWGDFKGSPRKLMKRYFDAHVYLANWASARFVLRLPIDALTQETADIFSVEYFLDIETTKTHWIVAWCLEESENYDRFATEDGSGWMAWLAPVRDELLGGDIRSLYIGWLAAASARMIDDDEVEPPGASGLGSLTAAQQALAKFLDVDPDLLAGAGIDSTPGGQEGPSPKEMDQWIDDLPQNEVKAVLRQLLDGEGLRAERSLRNRFSAWCRGLPNHKNDAPRRTLSELRRNAEKARQIRLAKEKRERERREAERRRKRIEYLSNMAKDFPKAWKAVRKTVERGSGRAYDDACRALGDISEAYELQDLGNRFQEEMKEFMADNMKRKALIQRLVKASIWEDG